MRNRQLKTYDDVRDLSIIIMDLLIDRFGIFKKDGMTEDKWYPWDIQDAITEKIQQFAGITE